MPSFEGNLLAWRHEICHKKLDSTLSQGKNRESVFHLGFGSVPGRDGQNYDS